GVFGMQSLGAGGHGHGLRHRADFKVYVEPTRLFSFYDDALGRKFLEAAYLHCNRVTTWWQESNSIEALITCGRLACEACILLDDGNFGPGDSVAGRVHNCTLQTGLELRESGDSTQTRRQPHNSKKLPAHSFTPREFDRNGLVSKSIYPKLCDASNTGTLSLSIRF